MVHPKTQAAPSSSDIDCATHSTAQQKGCEPWRSGDAPRYSVPKPEDPWQHCYTLVKEYDKGALDVWKDEIDKLLIFAGLFSAAVTAFTIESYQWLQEDPNDVSAHLLAEIATQLKQPLSNNVNASTLTRSFVVAPAVVRINVLWFLSLTLSLTTVLVGILCLQWLREYHRDAALPHKDAVALRQMRYEGFSKWRVSMILSSLPLLLQSAVILFFAGILELLWTLNTTVATFITIAISLVVLFLFLTTIAPLLQYLILGERHFHIGQCPYKSPQSWAFYRLGLCISWLIIQTTATWIKWSTFSIPKVRRSLHDQNWTEYDIRQWRRLRGVDDLVNGLTWIDKTFTQSIEVVYSLYHCLQEVDISAAGQVISCCNPEAVELLHNVFDDYTTLPAVQKRDSVNASFWELHRRAHPSLGTFYLENIVRILNTQDTRPFIDWPVRDLLTFPNDIIEQFLMCIKVMIAHERVTSSNITTIWSIVQRLVRQIEWGADFLEPHMELAFAIIEEFERWLIRSTPLLEQRHRIALCVYGMIKVFRPSFDLHSLEPHYLGKTVSLVRALDNYLAGMTEESAILTRFVGQRWEELVTRCSSSTLRREAQAMDTLGMVDQQTNYGLDNR